jgi:chromosome partitioning protein
MDENTNELKSVERMISFLNDSKALKVSQVEKEANMPSGTLQKTINGQKSFPNKYIKPLNEVLSKYGYDEKNYKGKNDPLGIVISFWVVKGGTGKTFLSKNVGYSLANKGYRVLLIDNDHQGNLTTQLPTNDQSAKQLSNDYTNSYELYQKFPDIKWNPFTLPNNQNIDLIPGSESLSEARVKINNMPNNQTRIQMFIKNIKDNYDFIIIDPRPDDYDILAINTITASNYVFLPVNPDGGSFEGIDKAVRFIIEYGEATNAKPAGIILNKFKSREQASTLVQETLSEKYPELFFSGVVRNDTNAEKTTFTQQSVFEHDPHSNVSKDINVLTEEILNRVL